MTEDELKKCSDKKLRSILKAIKAEMIRRIDEWSEIPENQKDVCDKHIRHLGLEPRLEKRLVTRLGFDRIGYLLNRGRYGMRRYRTFGDKTIAKIDEQLRGRGIYWSEHGLLEKWKEPSCCEYPSIDSYHRCRNCGMEAAR